MDLSEMKELEQPKVGTLKLSEAIREGLKRFPERRADYCGCAIGLAARGAGYPRDDCWKDMYTHLERVCGVPHSLLNRIDLDHCSGIPASEIADCSNRKATRENANG